MKNIVLAAGAWPLFAIAAQLPDGPSAVHPPQFEVASVRPSRPDATGKDARIAFRNGRFEALNVTLLQAVDYLASFSGNVRGGPGWAGSDRYDIVAKAEGDADTMRRLEMVKRLLEDRFKLVIHHESEQQTALVLAPGKSLPRGLKPAKDNEPTLIQPGEQRQLVFQSVSMDVLASYLHGVCRATILNRTGVAGKFDFTLDLDSAITALSTDSSHHIYGDFVRAAAEQFGFRIEEQKVAADVIVIDHAERPSEN